MKVVLFDLGQTLENNGTLRDDAIETLKYVQSLKDTNNQSPILGLASDNEFPGTNADQARKIYYDLLKDYEIDDYFKPLSDRVTLSKDVCVTKDENLERFFQKVIEKIDNKTNFTDIIFITEYKRHIDKANELGTKTIFLNLDNVSTNERQYTIRNLKDAKNILKDLINEVPVNLSNKS